MNARLRLLGSIAAMGLLAATEVRATPESPAAASSPWSALAARDLEAIHDALEADHPGPVDRNNPGFRIWLTRGLDEAKREAARASSFSDYRRAVLRYVSGFHDGHISLTFLIETNRTEWPGLLVQDDGTGALRIAPGSVPEELSEGDVLASCDGQTAKSLVETWINPYFGNPEIPHGQRAESIRLFLPDGYDSRRMFKQCVFVHEGRDVTVPMRWTRMLNTDVAGVLERASREQAPVAGFSQFGSVLVVSIPTFNIFGAQDSERMRGLLTELEQRIRSGSAGTVVVDLRGNQGGNSAWATDLATALWGPEIVAQIESGFDTSIEWRVSPDNIERLREAAARDIQTGHPEAAADRMRVADQMSAALGRSEPLLPDGAPAPRQRPLPTPRLKGVYVFTDGHCFSSCLYFLDIANRVPTVTQIGLPTSADTPYLDNADAVLPSGISRLSYSMKVYRNRDRPRNRWFEPAINWPGGPLTTETIAQWVSRLPESR